MIEKKLDNLAEQNQAMHLLVVDSASTDSTLELLNGWISRHPSTFASVEILRMEQRQGKTAAVVKALQHLGQHADGLICMTDADAMLERGCLQRLMQWFADPMIGAVGAVPNRVGGRKDECCTRAGLGSVRLAESMVDSTPFLEGSCMMWRPSCLAIDDLHTGANADDAQIATSVRCQGWRAVADPLATFIDVAPSTVEGQRRQKLRRAQGLQRLLTEDEKASGGEASGRVWTYLSTAASLSRDCSSGHHRGHGLSSSPLGVHRPVRLAGYVHAGQQPPSWFQCCRSGLFGVVVAQP